MAYGKAMKRWKAVALYEDQDLVFEFDEFVELGDWIEQGPNWLTIESIVITYQLDRDTTNG